ncbi:MAG: ABC efflux transporter ATP-binding protein [Candidatus Desulfovibrio kirbyi]|jgi:putative ABC transport system ATP-binding protein|uniref:ABC efflux transporter ATP-binding protein n=1 Tax=Candidatus Desulfovibrio kirbyi TaxID=2696086 RepID=A0A6L2R6V5_9BACT|nr:ABC transporter ATP-binding protein [Desulfovibrio sp.]GFH63276.1 MAG: ABC efflux transporter ATP-binding protein [Candidatus Desulfovibrio kirbyi]
MNILKLNDVSMVYGSVRALQNVSFAVRPGEWVAIMGASGSGKTTMMNIVGCMNKATHGSVVLDGENLSRLNAGDLTAIRRDKIGLIFQQFYLISYLTAVENVMIAQYYHSVVDEKEAMQALERVGLAPRAKHLPHQLSGGEQQRLCIARALINYPRLILADEPTGNLDKANQNTVMDIFHQLHREGSTIIVVTHSPEVAAHAQRVLSLEFGRLVKDAPTQRLCA